MPVDPRKRQKKLERREAKRKSKRQFLVREKHLGFAERMAAAARSPILHSWMSTDVWSHGLGSVLLSRMLRSDMVAYVVFLVDRYCLGVKDVMLDVLPRSSYDVHIDKLRDRGGMDMQPADVRKLVEGAVEYARSLGLPPYPDYNKAKLIFGDIDASESTETFEFGRNGRPVFIAGPHDSPAKCQRILKALGASSGEEGSDFLIPMPGSEFESDEELHLLGPDEGTIDELIEEDEEAAPR